MCQTELTWNSPNGKNGMNIVVNSTNNYQKHHIVSFNDKHVQKGYYVKRYPTLRCRIEEVFCPHTIVYPSQGLRHHLVSDTDIQASSSWRLSPAPNDAATYLRVAIIRSDNMLVASVLSLPDHAVSDKENNPLYVNYNYKIPHKVKLKCGFSSPFSILK